MVRMVIIGIGIILMVDHRPGDDGRVRQGAIAWTTTKEPIYQCACVTAQQDPEARVDRTTG